MRRDVAELATAAAIIAIALPFKVGDPVFFGKYKNKKGRIKGFGKNHKGQITVIVTPVPKGRKQDKEMGLFKIWTVEQATAAGSSCPVRTKMYGGLPGGGGYGSQTEFEIGAQRIAEAIHCFLGSLGSFLNLYEKGGSLYHGTLGHAKEEMEIVEKVIKEYAKPVYTERISDPTRDIKEQYKEAVRKSADITVESIRKASPRLYNVAKKYKSQFRTVDTLPEAVGAGMAAYDVVIALTQAMMRSVKGYPDRVHSPYPELRAAVAHLRRQFNAWYAKAEELEKVA